MSGLTRTRPTRASRRGMTLVEIMIALVLLGIISGVIMRVIMRQQRFYQGANEIMTQRSQLRQATSVLPVDLRSLSSVGEDILAVTDSSIDFRMNVATGVVCDVVGNAQIVLPPDNLASKQTLTSFFGYGWEQLKAGAGFDVFIYNDSSTVGNEDDAWKRYELAKDVTVDNSKCVFSFATVADAGKNRYVIEVSDPDGFTDPVTLGPLSQYIQVGAPVRIVKKVRYALYQEATDKKWYLGYANYNPATLSYETLAPVSGPYDPYSTTTGVASGLAFRYYDVDGNEIASGATFAQRKLIARVDLVARARTDANVRAEGIQNGVNQQYKDSLAVSVMLRNRQ
jgi:prepilin-type N-terminal cleavage/methylation domain-containing protein